MAAMDAPRLESTAELAEYLDTLPSLDAHIVDLENQLAVARSRRDAVNHRVKVLEAAKAPISRLPRELLGLIFEQYSEDQRRRNYVVMLVCRLWHSIVLATPRLWCDITLSMDNLESLAGHWKYAAACLSLSHAALLDIYIEAGRFEPPGDPFVPAKEAFGEMKAFTQGKMGDYLRLHSFTQEAGDSTAYKCALCMTLAVLRGSEDQHTGRWRSLYIEFSVALPAETPLEIWNSMDGVTSNLQSLDFLGLTNEIDDDGWTSTGFPVLSSLTSFSTDYVNPFQHKLVPTTQLQQLCLANSMASLHFLKEVASQCHHMQVLELCIKDVDLWSSGHPSRTVTLPNLRMLALSGFCHYKVMSIFDVPKLTHLSLVCCGAGYRQHTMLSTITDLRWDPYYCPRSPELLKPLLLSAPLLKTIHGVYENSSYFLSVVAFIESMTTEGITRACCLDNDEEWPYYIPRGRWL